jgi:hypothetical protein
MGDKRNARKPKAQTPAKSKPAATPSRSPLTRNRKTPVRAAASRIQKKGPVRLQLEDEGVSLDNVAEDILADLELTPGKNEATLSDGSRNDYEDSFEDGLEDFENFNHDMGSDIDEEDEPPPRIDFKRKKSNNRTQGGMLAILSHKDSPYEIPQVDLQLSMLIFHLRFLTMADTKR